MSGAFDRTWLLMKAFYLDPGGIPGWQTNRRDLIPRRANISHRNQEISRPPIADDKYFMGVNLAHPMMKYKDFRTDRKYDSETDRNYTEDTYGMEPMSEDEMMQQAIKVLLHEQGHGMLEHLLDSERHRAFYAGELGDYYTPVPTLQGERGALLMEGIPFEDQEDVLRRRGYL